MKHNRQHPGKILVTGATGNVGIEVVQFLSKENVPLVIGARDTAKSKKQIGVEAEYVRLDFENPDTYEEALADVGKIFLVRPPQISDVRKYVHPFIDLAKRKGLNHIVFLSLLGVEKNKVVPHYKIEQFILQSGIPYTFLRASFFMQNLNTTHREEIQKDHEICLPAGNGQTSFIDVRDIAEVGAMALLDDAHQNRAYDLTGSEALDYFQVAEVFSKVLGRKIVYTRPSILQFYRKMRKRGMAGGFVLVMIALYSTARFGLAKRTSNVLRELVGREPIGIEQYVRDYRKCWE